MRVNRGKILPSGVIILKYLPLNCLLVSLLHKTDNKMNLNGCDRGTARRSLVNSVECRATVRGQTSAALTAYCDKRETRIILLVHFLFDLAITIEVL